MFSISEVRRFASSQELRKVANTCWCCCCSVDKSCLTLYNPTDCPSLSTGVCSDSCPLSQWCHPTISSSVTHFSCPQFFPASGSFPVSQLFASGGQSIRASTSASVLTMNIQDWFPLGLILWFPCCPRDSPECLLQHCSSEAPILWCSAFFMVQLTHPYLTTEKKP